MRESDHVPIPHGEIELTKRIKSLSEELGMSERHLRSMVGNVVVGQFLPDGVVRGGTAMYLRRGPASSRFSSDFDVSRKAHVTVVEFEDTLMDRLTQGWHGFRGRLARRRPAKPPVGVPDEYVMVPYDLKLTYQGVSWFTVPFELGHEELGGNYAPVHVLHPSSLDVFRRLGLPDPEPIALLPVEHQIAQKLHACTTGNTDRAHDLVDLQLLVHDEAIDYAVTRDTCRRLFASRGLQTWPPTVVAGPRWADLYAQAQLGLPVRTSVQSAVEWTNQLVAHIEAASANSVG